VEVQNVKNTDTPQVLGATPQVLSDGQVVLGIFLLSFFKEVARGGERTRVLSISFNFSFSPLYR
jgi:hypothetical protein